jgi:hypothetical protein
MPPAATTDHGCAPTGSQAVVLAAILVPQGMAYAELAAIRRAAPRDSSSSIGSLGGLHAIRMTTARALAGLMRTPWAERRRVALAR